ncbi:MAG: hypothetical protein ACI4UE_05380 [Candidatus Scatovivens sp.]
MAIISFWSEGEKESAQTLSMVALATYMAIDHNTRVLIVDATFDDDTINRCFLKNTKEKQQVLSQFSTAKIDISSGAEGLVSAIASNKVTPEIVKNYTKIIFKNRLDVLFGLKTKIPEEHEKSLMLYKDLLITANKYYDFVFVDLNKTYTKETTKAILEKSTVVVYTMVQNLKMINNFVQKKEKIPLLNEPKILPLLGSCNIFSNYNERNTARHIGEKRGIAYVPYNSYFMECASEGNIADYFLKIKFSKSEMNKNDIFLKGLNDSCNRILNKVKELQLRNY